MKLTCSIDEIEAIPSNFIKCLKCKNNVILSGSQLTKSEVSLIADEKHLICNKKREEELNRTRHEVNELRKQLEESNKRRRINETDEERKDMLINTEVAKIFPRFEKLLLLVTPCCNAVFQADGCQAIHCDPCGASFCGLCLSKEHCYKGDKRNDQSHRHVRNCPENEHYKGNYFTPEFYPQYCCFRRFANEWNNFIWEEDVSFDVVAKLIERIEPMIKDSNLVFDDNAQVVCDFTAEQRAIVNPPPREIAPPRGGEQAAGGRRRPNRCGHCRLEGHNRARCPELVAERIREREEREREREAIAVREVIEVE